MKILLVGSGGREHALGLKLKASERDVELFAAPGSDALGELGTCLSYGVEDLNGLCDWCAKNRPDLVVIGPEAPLVAGLSDRLTQLGIPVFGHPKATAHLEGSKAYAKDFMSKHGVPCARSITVTDLVNGENLIRQWDWGFPLVLKADGLAAGKGVVLTQSHEEAVQTLRSFMAGQYGEASRKVVLEEPLIGMELSLHVLVDVEKDRLSYMVLPPCQDHKRIFEGDNGPNTGGMGAFGPIPFLKPEDLARLEKDLVLPTLTGMQKEGLEGRGVLFLGVIWTEEGPKMIEYNVRFGDPETQVLMELLDEDLPGLLLDVANHRLKSGAPRLKPGCAITVVLASEGYPDGAKKGVVIEIGSPVVTLVHAGTKREGQHWVTNGGRVLNLVTRADNLEIARTRIERALAEVDWPGMQVRLDIGLRALKHDKAGKGIQEA